MTPETRETLKALAKILHNTNRSILDQKTLVMRAIANEITVAVQLDETEDE